jgi:hypothetical protein
MLKPMRAGVNIPWPGLGDRGDHAKDTLRQPRLSLTRFPRRQLQSPQKHRVPKFGQLHVVDSSVVS